MEKPDAKKIMLNMAEDNVRLIVEQVVKPYAQYYIMQSENKIDDVLLPFIDVLLAELEPMIDKIDGEEG